MYLTLNTNYNSGLLHLFLAKVFSHTQLAENNTNKQTRSPLAETAKKLIKKEINAARKRRKIYKVTQFNLAVKIYLTIWCADKGSLHKGGCG